MGHRIPTIIPEAVRWDAERQAVVFGVAIGERRGVVRSARRVFQRLLPERPTPQAVRRGVLPPANPLESIVEPKLHRRQLAEDSKVEISGRLARGVKT